MSHLQLEQAPIVVRPKIILASGSPRRKELLARLGWDFEIVIPDVDEDIIAPPAEMVLILSQRKACHVTAGLRAGIVLAADTMVALGGELLGKPESEADAARMLRLLSGRAHEVYTGVCLMDAVSGHMERRAECTKVWFRALSEGEIADYIATGEPMDKAGAYGIQGGASRFVERIEGSFENVMGLPVEVLSGMYDSLTMGGQ